MNSLKPNDVLVFADFDGYREWYQQNVPNGIFLFEESDALLVVSVGPTRINVKSPTNFLGASGYIPPQFLKRLED